MNELATRQEVITMKYVIIDEAANTYDAVELVKEYRIIWYRSELLQQNSTKIQLGISQ